MCVCVLSAPVCASCLCLSCRSDGIPVCDTNKSITFSLSRTGKFQPGKNTKKKKRQTPKANKNKDELEKGFVGQGEEAAAWLGGQGLQSREERGDAGG